MAMETGKGEHERQTINGPTNGPVRPSHRGKGIAYVRTRAGDRAVTTTTSEVEARSLGYDMSEIGRRR